MILDGKLTAKTYENELTEKILKAKSLYGRVPHLSVILVGSNKASLTYVKSKKKACLRVGMTSDIINLPVDISEESLLEVINGLNQNCSVDGILVQLPLPDHINEAVIVNSVLPYKDVDGLNILNAGKVYTKTNGIVPATPLGIMMLLEKYQISIAGKHAVVVGRSNLVGMPISKLLLDQNATVTVCHSKTVDLSRHTKTADILVVAVGIKGFINQSMVKKGAVVIDVGINRVDGKLYGDVDSNVLDVAGYMTPVPGGVGPMTINALLFNVLKQYEVTHDC